MSEERKRQTGGKQSKPTNKKIGRPSKFTIDLGAEICGRIAIGESLRSICRSDHMPDVLTVYRWLAKDEEFRYQYALAREDQAETHADEIISVADEMPPSDMNGKTDSGYVSWQKNRIDARKWVASKLKPKKYGDRIGLDHQGGVNISVVTGVPDE